MGEDSEGQKGDDAKGWRMLLFAILGFALLIPVSCGVIVAVGSSGERSGPSDVEVRNQCRRWVEDRLVAPADAEYSNEVVTGDGPWVVTGTVDAPNRLGVTIRMAYDCDIRLNGDRWRGSATVTE